MPTASVPAVIGVALLPHGAALDWEGVLIALHAVGDGLIGVAFFALPVAILYFLRKRSDVPFPAVFWMFAAFLFLTGLTHWAALWTLWHAHHWLAGSIKLLAGVMAVCTAVALVRVLSPALALPSPHLLRRINEELEQRVQTRTGDLSASNERLAREVKQREQAEAEVRRLNQSLQERVHELQTVLDLLPVGIGIAQDPECREIRTNKLFADMLGLPPQSNASLSAAPFQPQPFKVYQGDRELKAEELPLQRATRENTAISDFEERIVRSDGRELYVVVNAVPLRDAEGKSRGCVATIQDITAHKAAAEDTLNFERRLQETQKLESLGVLAGGIAHDFNNLLTGILGNASIARLELPSGHAPVRSALDNLEHAAMRAADLCKQMLAYAGKGRFVVQPLSLSGIVRETSELLEVSISKRAGLRLELADGLPAFQGDATQIRQVLMNLVINASEAIGDRDGLITIRTSAACPVPSETARLVFSDTQKGPFVCLEVTDTGCGMNKQMLARIFDPFFTTKFTGRGLGLAAVQGIVRGHKGMIDVESAPNSGTTFRIYLPALEARATPPDPILQASSENKRTGTILVVDDEPAVRAVAARVLRNAGYAVTEAGDGKTAVELVRDLGRDFSLVLLDLTMPRMDGEEAFRLMRDARPSLRIVVMSGFNEQDTENRFSGQGLSGFVPKPFGAETLLSKVQSVLKQGTPKSQTA